MKYFYVKETENSVEELFNYYIRLGYNPEWINQNYCFPLTQGLVACEEDHSS